MLMCCSLLLWLLWCTVPTWAEEPEADTNIQSLTSTIGVYKNLQNIDGQCTNQKLKTAYTVGLSLFVGNSSGQMTHGKSEYIDTEDMDTETLNSLYEDLHQPSARFLLDITCLLHSQHTLHKLNCSWNNADVPAKAQHSVTGRLCSENGVLSSWNCTLYNQGKFTGCQGNTGHLQNHYATVIQVNVSVSGLWYIHTEYFRTYNIEKLDPPKNISWSFIEGNQALELQWEKAISRTKMNSDCVTYQIKIDDEEIQVKGKLNYLKQDIDPNRKYRVQIRVKRNAVCTDRDWMDWGDWSEPIEVGPAKEPQPEYTVLMIAAIVLGLPMILLVFLLVFCRIQRVLFPPIPRPNIQIKQLLEKDFAFQAPAEKHAEEVQVELVSEVEICKQ